MEKIKITVPESTLKAWEGMDDWNQHGLRLEAIAAFFYSAAETQESAKADFLELYEVLRAINKAHEGIGYLTEFLHDLRSTCWFKLRVKILEYFGEDVLHEVNP